MDDESVTPPRTSQWRDGEPATSLRTAQWAQLRSLVAAGSVPVTAVLVGPDHRSRLAAAERIAADAGRDLHRIDVSRVAGTFVTETAANLGRSFETAEATGAVLLLDEADALFGKRTGVRDAHDRYADAAVGALLERMKDFDGVIVVSTGSRGAVDQPFLRRLTMVLDTDDD